LFFAEDSLAARAGLTKGEAAELLAAVLGDWD
jgi:hypothetical protein